MNVDAVNKLITEAQKTPYFHLEGYMNRWWAGEGYRARVHQILRSDREVHLHDHPWDYSSLILRNAYIEVREDGSETEYSEGSLLHRNATDKHRLILPRGEVWTLVVLSEKKNDWGFYTPEGKVPWREYLTIDDPTAQNHDAFDKFWAGKDKYHD